jgi:nitronate monooxygenase
VTFAPDQLEAPIVQAPLAGGPSTPALAAAVAEAGGLGFLAAGYRSADGVREDIAALRALTGQPFGVNLFAPPRPPSAEGDDAVARYRESLRGEAERLGVALGEPRHDDDGWEAKLALVAAERVPVVSFTFGCPPLGVVDDLHGAGAAVWVTVTTPQEAASAARVGADALVVQGAEAGGHRGSFDDAAPGEIGLLALLQLVAATVDLPLIAAGGLATGRAIAAVLAAGASAAALGSALMLTPEAATSAPHRAALAAGADTALTRAFTGRLARGLDNRFLREHGPGAPSAYPEIHHVTAPLRAAGRERGDADVVNLWAGQTHALASAEPAADVVRRLAAEARAALAAAARRHGTH